MDFAIIGSGNVGGALAHALTEAGHRVTITSRNGDQAIDVAAATGATAVPTIAEAARAADVVFVAVPFGASGEAVARELESVTAGKVVVDVTNPVNPSYDGLLTDRGPSAAEQFAAWLPEARVVKAFNTLFASLQADPGAQGVPLDLLGAGDDAAAKALVMELGSSLGFQPIDAGPLSMARHLEAVAFLNIALQPQLGQTWRTAWRLVGVPIAA
jgi:NADPH-dependent F420 reductase